MMMHNPLTFAYSVRHLAQRKAQSVMTLGGIALVVFVFAATLMLAEGLRETLAATGSPDNVMALMIGAQNEVESGIKREAAAVMQTQEEVLRLADRQPLATADLTVLITLPKRHNGQTSNVAMRGISPGAFAVRPQVRLAEGRMFAPGTQEVIVGRAVMKKYSGTDLGQELHLVGTKWRVVGIFDAGNTAFNSEIWGDVNILLSSFRREQFSSVTFRMQPGADFEGLKLRLEKDPRLAVSIQRERDYYEAQSQDLAMFIRYLGIFVSIVFSMGAVIGAMITMYSAVANRIREIGILRALGFSQMVVFWAFVKECLVIGFVGGVCGLVLASSLSFITFATTNFATFADLAFGFKLTPAISLWSLVFALLMSLAGGALPAFRAARLPIIDTLRAE